MSSFLTKNFPFNGRTEGFLIKFLFPLSREYNEGIIMQNSTLKFEPPHTKTKLFTYVYKFII